MMVFFLALIYIKDTSKKYQEVHMYIIDSVSLIHVRNEHDRHDLRTAAERARDFPHDLTGAT